MRKELATLRMIWNRMHKREQAPPFAWKLNDLTWPKSSQKEPFKTWEEIERRITTGGLSRQRIKALWECLYLDEAQISECLAWVREHGRHAFEYSMFAFAAYTGARRSEILRSELEDLKFANNTLEIREKKSDSARVYTIRSIPLHPTLAEVMRGWFDMHAGRPYTIATDRREAEMSPRMASKYFRQALAGGKWRILHGFHVFRHSLASIMASRGKDQRVINAILGHSTLDKERRYRHLFPPTQAETMKDLFR